jgi:hypothetical protein
MNRSSNRPLTAAIALGLAAGLLTACASGAIDPDPGYDEEAWCDEGNAFVFFSSENVEYPPMNHDEYLEAITWAVALAPASVGTEADTVVTYLAGMGDIWDNDATIEGITPDQYNEAFAVVKDKWRALCE